MEHPYQFEYISYSPTIKKSNFKNSLKQKLDNKNISNKNQKLTLKICQECLKLYNCSRNSCDCIKNDSISYNSNKRKRVS